MPKHREILTLEGIPGVFLVKHFPVRGCMKEWGMQTLSVIFKSLKRLLLIYNWLYVAVCFYIILMEKSSQCLINFMSDTEYFKTEG